MTSRAISADKDLIFCARCGCDSRRSIIEAESLDDQLRCRVCSGHLGYRKTQQGAFGGPDRKRVAAGEG